MLDTAWQAAREAFSIERDALEAAIELSQQQNITFLPRGIAKCVVYLDPKEYHSTWLGNKAIYRTRMAIADGGELVILAPGVDAFGEDGQVDALIRKYGYCGRERAIALLNRADCADLRENASAAAHLIHGSSDGRFTVSYAVRESLREAMAASSYKGITGTVTFDAKGDWVRPYLFVTVKDGKFVVAK